MSVHRVASGMVALGLGDTAPAPVVGLLDSNGVVVPASGVEMVFTKASDGSEFTVTGVEDGDTWKFPVPSAETAAADIFRTRVQVTTDDGVATYGTHPVYVVDYTDLWADPALVNAPDASNSEKVVALLQAEQVVREWVTSPISSPVSDTVAHAVALLATRSLTTSAAGSAVVSETIGDYTVRFARPQPGGMAITEDIANMLAPWRPRTFDVYVGPDGGETTYLATVTEDIA